MNTQDATAVTRERNPDDQFYNGNQFSLLEIEDAHRLLGAQIKTLRENFDRRHPTEIKLAAEVIAVNSGKIGGQIATLASVLATSFTTRINRRPR